MPNPMMIIGGALLIALIIGITVYLAETEDKDGNTTKKKTKKK